MEDLYIFSRCFCRIQERIICLLLCFCSFPDKGYFHRDFRLDLFLTCHDTKIENVMHTALSGQKQLFSRVCFFIFCSL